MVRESSFNMKKGRGVGMKMQHHLPEKIQAPLHVFINIQSPPKQHD